MPIEEAELFDRLEDELVLHFGQHGKNLINEEIEQALRVDWSVELPSTQNSHDRAQ